MRPCHCSNTHRSASFFSSPTSTRRRSAFLGACWVFFAAHFPATAFFSHAEATGALISLFVMQVGVGVLVVKKRRTWCCV